MARVPVITSPCPLRWKSMPSAGMDFCGQCQRRVHNLDAMSDGERESFFATCSGDVCVAYTVSRPRAMIGAIGLGVATAALATGAFAEEAQQSGYTTQVTGPTCDPKAKELDQTITVGGIKSARNAKLVEASEVAQPERPVIGEVNASDWLPSPNAATQTDAH
jgi:hypothetical protein